MRLGKNSRYNGNVSTMPSTESDIVFVKLHVSNARIKRGQSNCLKLCSIKTHGFFSLDHAKIILKPLLWELHAQDFHCNIA